MEFLNSPFVVPVAAFLVAIVAIVAGVIGQAHARRLKAEQRMTMLGRGMSVADIEHLLGRKDDEAEPKIKDPLRSLANTRRSALVLISTAVGLILFGSALALIVHKYEVLVVAASGLIPLAIGVGFLIDYRMQAREMSRFGLEVGAEIAGER